MYQQIGDCVLRDFDLSDKDAVARHANNRRIRRNLRDAFPHPYTPEDAERFISTVISELPVTVFAIATESEAIGSIGLTFGQDVHRYTAELGYWLAEPYWGRGIVTKAVRAVALHGIRDLGLHRVFAEPFSTNSASLRVLEKAGFSYEGTLRSSVYKEGAILDQVLYSYTRTDLEARE